MQASLWRSPGFAALLESQAPPVPRVGSRAVETMALDDPGRRRAKSAARSRCASVPQGGAGELALPSGWERNAKLLYAALPNLEHDKVGRSSAPFLWLLIPNSRCIFLWGVTIKSRREVVLACTVNVAQPQRCITVKEPQLVELVKFDLSRASQREKGSKAGRDASQHSGSICTHTSDKGMERQPACRDRCFAVVIVWLNSPGSVHFPDDLASNADTCDTCHVL
jgi:hypothetical protein